MEAFLLSKHNEKKHLIFLFQSRVFNFQRFYVLLLAKRETKKSAEWPKICNKKKNVYLSLYSIKDSRVF